MRAIQNKAFYKVFLKRQTPNIEAIEEHLAAFKKSEDLFLSNYLGNKDLMGGNDINVCDLIASATFEQVNILKHLSLNHLKLSCLLYRHTNVRQNLDLLLAYQPITIQCRLLSLVERSIEDQIFVVPSYIGKTEGK